MYVSGSLSTLFLPFFLYSSFFILLSWPSLIFPVLSSCILGVCGTECNFFNYSIWYPSLDICFPPFIFTMSYFIREAFLTKPCYYFITTVPNLVWSSFIYLNVLCMKSKVVNQCILTNFVNTKMESKQSELNWIEK